MSLEINWSDDKKEKVIQLIDDWIRKHNVTCGESVYQCDEPSIDSINIMSDIVDIVNPTSE